MKHSSKKILSMAVAAAIYAPLSAWATNGMNLEGYGPIALGMGGASMAYDNGTAAVMNNPATLGLMNEGGRLDVALGFLGPDVKASTAGMPDAKSSADSFYMPAVGYARKTGQLTYGVGLFAQGGMGTEYAGDSFMAAGSGETVRSEVGVGRLIAPLTYDAGNGLTVGGSIDFVWAGMDIKMAMSGAQFGDMVAALGGSQAGGTASGNMVDGMVGMMPSSAFGGPGACDPTATTCLTNVDWARFDFSNGSDYTGEAKGHGFAGKLGMVYKLNKQLTLGATYHSKTRLGDLETGNAKLSMQVDWSDGTNNQAIPVSGKIAVKDFQWPATMGIGAAFQATDKLMVVADVKRIKWADAMKDFSMTFTADNVASNGGFAGATLDAVLFQKWEDQTVISLGGAYKVTDALTLRAGFNKASNPIPDTYLNALFPAIVERHLTLGAGYQVSDASEVNFALSKASEVSATNPGNGSTIPAVKSTHSQLSWQAMYSHHF